MQVEPAITKAVRELERIGGDRSLRELYEAEEKARMIDAAQLQLIGERKLQQGMQQGIQQGIQQGMQQGMQQGQQTLLLRQMIRHIGEVPPGIQTRLGTLTPAQLDDLGEALFDLNSYADVEAWLSRQ